MYLFSPFFPIMHITGFLVLLQLLLVKAPPTTTGLHVEVSPTPEADTPTPPPSPATPKTPRRSPMSPRMRRKMEESERPVDFIPLLELKMREKPASDKNHPLSSSRASKSFALSKSPKVPIRLVSPKAYAAAQRSMSDQLGYRSLDKQKSEEAETQQG